jgi:hypothetical protein
VHIADLAKANAEKAGECPSQRRPNPSCSPSTTTENERLERERIQKAKDEEIKLAADRHREQVEALADLKRILVSGSRGPSDDMVRPMNFLALRTNKAPNITSGGTPTPMARRQAKSDALTRRIVTRSSMVSDVGGTRHSGYGH